MKIGDISRIWQRNSVTSTTADKNNEDTKSGGSSFKEKIVYANTEEGSLTVAAVYRAAELRANSIAALRMQYLIKDISKNYLKEDESTDGRKINYIIGTRPNSRQNAFQFWKAVEMARMFSGHAYIYPVWGFDGSLESLIPVTAQWNEPMNTYTISATKFGIYQKTVHADDLIVLRGIVTTAHPEGESIIHYSARTMNVSATSETLTLESAAKGGRQKLIMQQGQDAGGIGIGGIAPEEMEKQREKLQKSIYNDDVIYDDSSSKITPINLSMADMQLLESRKFTVSDIARFFGVPRTLLMDDTNSNYKSAESASLEFLSRTLQPIIREIEDEFDAKMLTQGEHGRHRFRFDTRPLFALDIETRSMYNKSRLETGIASVNELRAEANMPAIENGNDHYVSCNVAPIGSIKLSGATSVSTGDQNQQKQD